MMLIGDDDVAVPGDLRDTRPAARAARPHVSTFAAVLPGQTLWLTVKDDGVARLAWDAFRPTYWTWRPC